VKNGITIIVPCLPVAQPRARATAINGKARMYEAKKSHAIHEFKATCRLAAAQAHNGPPMEGPLTADILCVFPTKRKARTAKATKPDCDNLAKSACDALNGVLYHDDSQIVRLTVEKWHASADESPRVEISIYAHGEPRRIEITERK
jgi:Holliday junction resolvase RusA-like endonuclease